MKSPGHRLNILNPVYGAVGSGPARATTAVGTSARLFGRKA